MHETVAVTDQEIRDFIFQMSTDLTDLLYVECFYKLEPSRLATPYRCLALREYATEITRILDCSYSGENNQRYRWIERTVYNWYREYVGENFRGYDSLVRLKSGRERSTLRHYASTLSMYIASEILKTI